jgi:hypothetical protein
MTAYEALRNANPWSWLVVSIALVTTFTGCDIVYDANGFASTAGNCLYVLGLRSLGCGVSIASNLRSSMVGGPTSSSVGAA